MLKAKEPLEDIAEMFNVNLQYLDQLRIELEKPSHLKYEDMLKKAEEY